LWITQTSVMAGPATTPMRAGLQMYPVRLRPGQELSSALASFVREHQLTSAFVLSCVGSVTHARLRMADAEIIRDFPGHREIVSLVGTLSGGEAGHLHTSLSDVNGDVIGGHVVSMTIFTTAEVMIGHAPGIEFMRSFDAETGFDELQFEKTDQTEKKS